MVIRLSKKGTTVGIVLIFFFSRFVVANVFAKAGGKGLKVQVFVTKPFEVSGEAKIIAATNADYDLFESIFAPIGRSFHTVIQFPHEAVEVGEQVSICLGLERLRGCDSTINGPEKEPEQVYINLGTGNGNDFGSESSSSSAVSSESSSSANSSVTNNIIIEK